MSRIVLLCCLMLFSLRVSAQKKAPVIDLKKLPGNWVSADDPKYQVVFTDSSQTDLYENEQQAVLKYKTAKDQLTATDQESGQVYNYTILSLSEKSLVLQHHPRGNLLKFNRKP